MLVSKANGHESNVATKELLRKALHLLDELDKRESSVLRLHFGLKGSEPMTLAQIGKRLGLTRERVRQIETEALVKLNQGMDLPPSHEE
jgi:RNA polymerase primary sigma factor